MKKIFNVYTKNNYKVFNLFGIKFKYDMFKAKMKKFNKGNIVKNKIVFSNFNKGGYGDNPKYIAEEILRQNLGYELVWIVKDPKKDKAKFPKDIKLVKYNSKEALKELQSAKVWVSNTRFNRYIKQGLVKKNEQTYIQTWHGSLGIKRIEKDLSDIIHLNYKKFSQIDSQMTDYLISPSSFDTKTLSSCFWFDKKFLEIGYPRNDIFFLDEKTKSEKIKTIKDKLNIPHGKKILLYAPTFRDSKKIDVYDIDLNQVQKALSEKDNCEFISLVRLHPHLQKKSTQITEKYPDTINVTTYPDIQELLLISDVLITDYSSSIFDFMLMKKPAFFYAKDIKEYTKERGFYIDLEKMPFPVAYNNVDMVKNIENFSIQDYQQKLEEFMKNRICYDKGDSSKKCVELIKEKIETPYQKFNGNEAFEYLKKYLYVLDTPSPITEASKYPNTIWQMWWQGEEQAPELVKKCFESVKKYYPNNRIIITESNYKQYVDIPQYIIDKFKKGIIGAAQFSDIVRLLLLTKHGGVWIDSTCLLTAPIPENILNEDVFYFKSTTWSQNPTVPTERLLEKLIKIPTYSGAIHTGSNWFIVSKPNNVLLTNLSKIILEYWKYEDMMIDYYIFHLFLSVIITNNNDCKESFEKMYTLSNRNPHLLQMSLEDEFNQELFEDIKKYSFIHKLRYKKINKAKKNKVSFYNQLILK